MNNCEQVVKGKGVCVLLNKVKKKESYKRKNIQRVGKKTPRPLSFVPVLRCLFTFFDLGL